jgi:hypothetical protein
MIRKTLLTAGFLAFAAPVAFARVLSHGREDRTDDPVYR